MPDPFEQLRSAVEPADPDPAFAARLRARVARALSLPKGVTVSTTTLPPATAALTPYLAVRDARGAIAWYGDVFGAIARSAPVVMPDGRIGHAELAIGGAVLMLADEFPDIGHVAPASGGSPVTLHLSVPDVDALAAAAVAHGAELTRPPTTAEYGRSATVVDPFGHRWLLMAAAMLEPMRVGDIAYASLQVPDVARARAFFSSVLAWELEPDGTVAGSTPHHAIRASDGPPTLFLCITVDDAAAAVARAVAAGGQADAPQERPYGTVADCTDDQGVPFAVWQRTSASAPRAGAGGWRHGDLTYVTVEVANSARFRRFFSSVAGWEFAPGRVEDGWEVRDVAPMIGIHGGHETTVAVPMYVVDDITSAVDRVRAGGGVSTEPERQPYGVSATCTDDQGTRFYLIQY